MVKLMSAAGDAQAVTATAWPEPLDIFAFARNGEQLQGVAELRSMPRIIAEMAQDLPASAQASAQNGVFPWQMQGLVREERAEQGTRQRLFLQVTAQGGLWVTCQRCLQAYWQPLVVDNLLEIHRTEEAADAAPLEDDEVDPIVGSRQFSVRDMLEEELLLALPLAPKHDICPDEPAAQGVAGKLAALAEAAEAAAVEKKPSPFAVLAGLKTKKAD